MVSDSTRSKELLPTATIWGRVRHYPKIAVGNVWAFGCVLGTADCSLERTQFTMCKRASLIV